MQDLLWANSVFRSRSFPGELALGGSVCGVMLPLLDAFNHAFKQPIGEEETEGSVNTWDECIHESITRSVKESTHAGMHT